MSAPVPPSPLDRLLAAFRLLVRAEFPQLTYAGVYEYVVQAVSGALIDATPVDTTIALPGVRATLSPLVGALSPPKPGEKVWLVFLNCDPTRPTVIASGDVSSVALANGILAAARQTDAVQAGPFAGAITGGSAKVAVG